MRHKYIVRFSILAFTAVLGFSFEARLAHAVPIDSIPITSNGALGAISVPSGSVVFNTDFSDATNGGTYSINGIQQPLSARVVSLPASPGFGPNTPGHDAANIFAYDFTTISIGSSVTVSVLGSSSLVLLSTGSADIGGVFNLGGAPGQAGARNAGGGGGAGGGALSVFSAGNLNFTGLVDVSGGNGGLSYQTPGGQFGGSGGVGSVGGGSGGDGGFAQAGGKGGNGGNGALLGFQAKGASIGIFLDGGGGGGGGAYRGGPGGGGSSGGNAGVAGGLGNCPNASPGGKGGASRTGGGFFGGDGGASGGGNGTSGFLGGAGGGGGGGNAPNGQPGGAGGAGSIGAGGGGGGGGGDLCMSSPPLDNGGGGSGGGGDGKPGSVIASSAQKSGGGGGGGQVFLGVNDGLLSCTGTISAFGGTAPSGNGGDGLLTLVAAFSSNLHAENCLFDGLSAVAPGSGVKIQQTLSLANYGPFGGGGGGGAGGPGQPIPQPSSLLTLLLGITIALRYGRRSCE